jgi:hypothetical protein
MTMRLLATLLAAAVFASAACRGGSSGKGSDAGPPGNDGSDLATSRDVGGADVPMDVSGTGEDAVALGVGLDAAQTEAGSLDGDSDGGTSVRDPSTGQCPAGSSGQICVGEQAYLDCLTAACGTQVEACFGSNYANGDFTGGRCAAYRTCERACPCDAAGNTCVAACAQQYMLLAPECMACASSLQSCTVAAGCKAPVCTSTGTTSATGRCTALASCCGSLPSTTATSCQVALAGAGDVDATCAAVLEALQAAGYCSPAPAAG